MRLIPVALSALLAAFGLGCKCSADRDGAVGADCERAADCSEGLYCIEQVCRTPSAADTARKDIDNVSDEARTTDCRALIRAINEATAKYKHMKAETPVELLRLGDALTTAAETIGKVELDNARLKGLRDDYQQMTADLGKAARAAGNAGGDDEKLQAALRTMDSIGPRESRLLGKINRYCGAS